MFRLRNVGFAVLISAVFIGTAAAQSVPGPFDLQRIKLATPLMADQAGRSTARRDSLLNGTLIGLGAGVGAAAALDAVFCDNGFGGCDTPWAAYVTLGLLGASAGAGIDFLIGRNQTADAPGAGKATVRLAPVVGRSRQGVRASIRF